MSWVFESWKISWRCFSISIYRKFDLCYLCLFRLFSWSVNWTILISKLCLLFQTILTFWSVLILEIFSSWDIKKGQFQFSVTFSGASFLSVTCTIAVSKSCLFFQTILNLWLCWYWRFLMDEILRRICFSS